MRVRRKIWRGDGERDKLLGLRWFDGSMTGSDWIM
jgi:hypothetical protein